MNGASVVSNIIEAFTGMLSGAASAIVSLFQTVFMNAEVVEGVTTYSGISPVGIWMLTFIGVGLGIGILRRVTGKVL